MTGASAKHHLGRYAEAIADYNVALQLDPQNTLYLVNRGLAKSDLGHYAEAIADYNATLQLDPHHIQALINRGLAKFDLGHYAEGHCRLQRRPATRPSPYPGLEINRGAAKAHLGFEAEALADYNAALHQDPHNAEILYSRGRANNHFGHYADAITDYDAALSLDPLRMPELWNDRGSRQGTASRSLDADADSRLYDAALQLDPNFAMAFAE